MKAKRYIEIRQVPSEDVLNKWLDKELKSKSPSPYLIDKYKEQKKFSGYYYFRAGFLIEIVVPMFEVKYESIDYGEVFGTIAAARKAARAKAKTLTHAFKTTNTIYG